MERTLKTLVSALATTVLALGLAAPGAAALSDSERKCLETVAKEGVKLVKKQTKTIQKCNDKNLKTPGDCPAEDLAGSLTKLEIKLRAKLGTKCGTLNAFNFKSIGYPGKCLQAVPGGDFTLDDLEDCIYESHVAIVDQLIAVEYGATAGPIADNDLRKCQREIAKNGGKFANAKHKAVVKCRNAINKGKLFGFAPKNCATADSKTKEKIDKAELKARDKILKKCTDTHVAALDVGAPGVPGCDPKATTAADAADCIIATHGDAVDNPLTTAPADLIDYEYATPLSCGDNILNSANNPFDLAEECDGTADAACPGQCGEPTGPFACLCLNKKRQRIIEHANADSDSGWTGITHDQRVVPGAGYLLDLYECDGVGDVECIVGPNCSVAPHAPCSNDAQCAALNQGTCRKERTAVGKHCNLDIKTACTSDAQCPGTGNFCVVTPHGPPLPLAAGGVSVCASTFFIEDVTGTTNLTTGETVLRVHQETPSRLGLSNAQPCPVCGGFCAGPVGSTDRLRNCGSDADCASLPGAPPCVTDFICSAGANADKECRPEPPFGGSNGIFGTTSIDCPPSASLALAGTIDAVFDPLTTGTVTLAPQHACNAPGFENQVCNGGANEGRSCAVDSECPGGLCRHQCFCPSGGGLAQQPNACEAACLGGGNDAAPCSTDSQCPGGLCHLADCRLNPLDPEGPDEGICTVGPAHNLCSITTFRQCNSDADCQPGPTCPSCKPGETCVIGLRQCFPTGGISRSGVASLTDPTLVAVYCLPAIPSAAVNTVSGFPGPASQRYPATRAVTGF